MREAPVETATTTSLADVDGLLAEEIAISVIGGANLPASAAISIAAAPIRVAGDRRAADHARSDRGTPPAVVPVTAAPIAAVPNATASPSSATTPQSTAEIPAADLAPLYNYVQDCRACQLELAVAKQNATHDAAKIRALTRERDAAVTAAKGGPIWLRLKRNAHWLAIGATIGAVSSAAALCHTGHCR